MPQQPPNTLIQPKRGDDLNADPLHGFLVGLKLFAEMLAELPEAHPGCLAASFCYQDQLFDREIRQLNAEGILAWRARFRERLDIIARLTRRAARSTWMPWRTWRLRWPKAASSSGAC